MSDQNNETQAGALNRLLKALSSGAADQQTEAMRELWTLSYSSQAILIQLEKIAISDSAKPVRQAALDLIDSKIHKHVRSQINKVSDSSRALLLNEIRLWVTDGLIENKIAFVLTRRYAFDKMPVKLPPVEEQKVSAAPVVSAVAVPVAAQVKAAAPAPSPVRTEAPRPVTPAAPRPTLMQTLLSETSIKVALYFGAFLVIASALILAALNEQARLPVLLVVTALFAVGAFALKKRLPQPSFALFIVFSFLLPINGNVLADTLKIYGTAGHIFWTVNFLFMASVWALSVWLYDSWFFSIASLSSIGLALMRASMIFGADNNAKAFTVSLTALIGLAVVYLFKKWKDDKFALPVFLCVQAAQAILLLVSFVLISFNLVNGATAPEWFFAALTWIGAAVFYVISPYLFDIPKIGFAFPAAASITLLPIMWLGLQIFHPSTETVTIGQIIWGALIATFSEIAFRQISTKLKIHNLPLLAASLITFFAAIIFGGSAGVTYFFAATLVTALAYTALMFIRPRFYVWIFALLAGLGAYFTFFNLSFIDSLRIPIAYQFLGATLLLLTPELFFKTPFASKDSWRWPAFVIGTIMLLISWTDILSEANPVTRAIVLAIYAILLMAHSIHFKRAFIGYFATASLMFSLSAVMSALNLDNQLHIAWTGLAAAYYLTGVLLKRRTASWSAMMRNSGLALGLIASVFTFATVEHFGGWFILIIGLMFAVEMFIRPSGFFEPASLVLFSAAIYLFMRDAQVEQLGYHLLAHSLLWLSGDMFFARTFKARNLQWVSRGVAAIITIVNFLILVTPSLAAIFTTTVCFAIYTAFFALYTWFYRQPKLGYAATTSLALFAYFTLVHLKVDAWLPVLTALAVAYYAAGFLLKSRASNWGEMLRFSALALTSIVSFAAFFALKPTGGWYALIVGILFVIEMRANNNGAWFEPGPLAHFSIASFLLLRDFNITSYPYIFLASALVWLGGDMIFHKVIRDRKLAWPVRGIGILFALAATTSALTQSDALVSTICFGVLSVFSAVYAGMYRKPMIAYASTITLPLAVFFGAQAISSHWSPIPLTIVAILYYAAGYVLRRAKKADGWDSMLWTSGIGLGILLSLLAPFRIEFVSSIPVAVTATFVAFEAFHRRNVWLGFPANLLYLESYFIVLGSLRVDQPQFFSIGIAALGMLMHYLLTRAGSNRAAFLTGMFSQVVLLGTSYIQMVSTQNLEFYAVIFFQALAVLIYGIVSRSRSLLLTPIAFSVLATMTVVYKIVKNLGTVILVGCTGVILLLLGIVAVMMRERITTFTERFKDWSA